MNYTHTLKLFVISHPILHPAVAPPRGFRDHKVRPKNAQNGTTKSGRGNRFETRLLMPQNLQYRPSKFKALVPKSHRAGQRYGWLKIADMNHLETKIWLIENRKYEPPKLIQNAVQK